MLIVCHGLSCYYTTDDVSNLHGDAEDTVEEEQALDGPAKLKRTRKPNMKYHEPTLASDVCSQVRLLLLLATVLTLVHAV